MNSPTKELAKLLQDHGHRHHLHDIFRDFVEMSACAISNTVDMAQRVAREARYMALIGKYDKRDQERFPKMLGLLVQALDGEPADVLGEVFSVLEQGNARAGQFFTPYHVSRLMACLTVGDAEDAKAAIRERGFLRVCEPACGAGGMVIGLAEALREKGINYQREVHVMATDIDARAVHMAYLQLSLLHIPAIVQCGDSIRLEVRDTWYTPAHIVGGWNWRLRAARLSPEASIEHKGVEAVASEPAQFDLFGQEAA